MKKAKNEDEAEKLLERYAGQPNGRLQWKGTDACLDFYCVCGVHLHFDAYFLYNVQCGHCQRYFHLNPNIEIIEIEETPQIFTQGLRDEP